MNGVARALQVGQKGKGAKGQEEGDDGDDAAGVSDDGELDLVGRIVEENRVEVHEDGEVGEMVARAFRVSLVGGNEAAPGSRPTPGRGGRGGGGRVVPKHAPDCRKEKMGD